MVKDRSGFTLIEVLVVLGILGAIIPVFLTVAAYSRNMNYQAWLRLQAIWLAERVAEELLSTISNTESLFEQLRGEPIRESGHEPPFQWESTVQTSLEVPGQVEVIVEVCWRYGDKDRSLQVATYAR